jgi:hypothetical protein
MYIKSNNITKSKKKPTHVFECRRLVYYSSPVESVGDDVVMDKLPSSPKFDRHIKLGNRRGDIGRD